MAITINTWMATAMAVLMVIAMAPLKVCLGAYRTCVITYCGNPTLTCPSLGRVKNGIYRRFKFTANVFGSWQDQLSTPIVKAFLALAMRLATKDEALSALALDDVVAYSYCFCPSFFTFISFKKLKWLVFGCRVLWLQVPKQYWWLNLLICEPVSPHIMQRWSHKSKWCWLFSTGIL